MPYRDKASIITLPEKQSVRDKRWDIVSRKTWSIRRNGAALFQFNAAAAIRFRQRMNSHMMPPSQMCLQLGPLKGFRYWSSISGFVSYIVSLTNTDFYLFFNCFISHVFTKARAVYAPKSKMLSVKRGYLLVWMAPTAVRVARSLLFVAAE